MRLTRIQSVAAAAPVKLPAAGEEGSDTIQQRTRRHSIYGCLIYCTKCALVRAYTLLTVAVLSRLSIMTGE